MGRHIRPAKVYQTAQKNLATRILFNHRKVPPPWLKAVESIPPTETLTRTYAVQHTVPNPRAKRPSRLYRPTPIVYPEDQLRKDFYKDHPWELARPRIIMEMDGMDGRYRDWSKGLRQPDMPLSGESVVQRQLWLMENKGMSKELAYDEVRRDFYRLRQEEEVERRIAQEEARMVGAYFGKTALQVGMQLEDKEFERWKKWAQDETMKIEAERSQAYTSFGGEEDAAEADPEIEAAVV